MPCRHQNGQKLGFIGLSIIKDNSGGGSRISGWGRGFKSIKGVRFRHFTSRSCSKFATVLLADSQKCFDSSKLIIGCADYSLPLQMGLLNMWLNLYCFNVKSENDSKEFNKVNIAALRDFVNLQGKYEPHHEKTGFLPRRKQRRRSASR